MSGGCLPLLSLLQLRKGRLRAYQDVHPGRCLQLEDLKMVRRCVADYHSTAGNNRHTNWKGELSGSYGSEEGSSRGVFQDLALLRVDGEHSPGASVDREVWLII